MAFMDSEVGVGLELKRCIWFKVSGRCYGPWNRRVTGRRALQVGTCLEVDYELDSQIEPPFFLELWIPDKEFCEADRWEGQTGGLFRDLRSSCALCGLWTFQR